MKKLLLVISLLATSTTFAGSGTTYCPQPSDFKYDRASGSMLAPGGWALPLGNITMTSFVKAEATPHDGNIVDCTYNIKLSGTPIQVPATATHSKYVADDITQPIWKTGTPFKACVNTDPTKCTFHQASLKK